MHKVHKTPAPPSPAPSPARIALLELHFTHSDLQECNGEDLEDMLEIRLENANATEEQCKAARNALATVLLSRYYHEDQQHYEQEAESESRTRYVTIKPFIASHSELRQASRRPDILRGIAANKFGILAAAPGTGKSMLALSMCAAVASGRSILGFQPHDENGQNALFVSLEEDSDEVLLRWQAMRQVYDIDTQDRLHIAGENNIKFHTAGGAEEFISSAVFDLAELITQTQAKFVILDPLAQWRLGNEDNATFSLFSSAIKQLCVHCDTTIMVIHHIRKPPAGFQSESHNADSIRGASDLRGAARTILLLDYETKIAEGVISLCFDKVQYGKSKHKLPPMTMTQEIVETDKGNYETGVLVAYVPAHEQPMPAHEVDDYKKALRTMFETWPHYRSDIRSSKWLGFALAEHFGLDVGIGRKSAERTPEQHDALAQMKNNIARLVRMDLISPSHADVIGSNRQVKQVQTYTRGYRLGYD